MLMIGYNIIFIFSSLADAFIQIHLQIRTKFKASHREETKTSRKCSKYKVQAFLRVA